MSTGGDWERPPDPAEAGQPASRARRVGGWSVEQWLAWLERHPDGCLPSGVGWAIVQHLGAGKDGVDTSGN